MEGKAEEMVEHAKSFHRGSKAVRRKQCLAHIKYKLLIGGCLSIVLVLLVSPYIPRSS